MTTFLLCIVILQSLLIWRLWWTCRWFRGEVATIGKMLEKLPPSFRLRTDWPVSLPPGLAWEHSPPRGILRVDLALMQTTDWFSGQTLREWFGEKTPRTLVLPGVALLWSNGTTATSITVTSGGGYTVTANANGCTTTDAILVSYTPLPQPDLGPDRTLCEGDSLILTVQPATASVLWSTGSANDSLLITASDDVIVTLTLDGCVSSDAVGVTFLPVVDDIDLGPDGTICLGKELVLDATVYNAHYDWNTGDDDPRIQVTMPGTYHVILSGPCINAADTIVITEGNCAPLVYVPSSFTPNGDGINELFAPVTVGSFRHYSFLIFDRWGENIFSSDAPGEPWDGTVNGTAVQDAVYV